MDELLKILKHNALETPENIAGMLDISVEDAKAKIADYEKIGIIRGYQAIIDEDKLGLGRVTAVIEVKVTPEREGGFNRIGDRIGKFPEVTSMYLMSGAFDVRRKSQSQGSGHVRKRETVDHQRCHLHVHAFHAENLQASRSNDDIGR